MLELLEKEEDVEVVGVARDGREAAELVNTKKPDLLFLDIQMPVLDGFGVVERVGPDEMPVTIFVTAYDSYAIQAFEAHALDYLLKPFSDERFEMSLERARHQLRAHRASELGQQLASLLTDSADEVTTSDDAQSGKIERVVIKSRGRVSLLAVDDIDWVEAAGVYVYLHAGEKAHLYRATIGQFTERLDSRRFLRIHRSATINTSRIQELHPRSHGDYTIMLQGGVELTLSRKYRPQFERWLKQPL